jgi:phosphopantothenoylcysteine decarboxylase / phosphopantothenate---cysteine ligase
LTPKTRILLGVTGGIAAYKSPDLVRRLIERGADVQVVMTGAAQRFVSPMSFQAVSGRPTRSDLWDDTAEDDSDRAGERGLHCAPRRRARR